MTCVRVTVMSVFVAVISVSVLLFARKIKLSSNVSEKKKIDQKLFFLLAKGCVIEQNARKQAPFEIQCYCLYNINLPIGTFFKA